MGECEGTQKMLLRELADEENVDFFYTFNHLKSDARMRELGRLQNSKTKYMILSLTLGGSQLKDATTVHLGSSLSQAEEQGALFAAGGPVKILVEFTELETSPV